MSTSFKFAGYDNAYCRFTKNKPFLAKFSGNLLSSYFFELLFVGSSKGLYCKVFLSKISIAFINYKQVIFSALYESCFVKTQNISRKTPKWQNFVSIILQTFALKLYQNVFPKNFETFQGQLFKEAPLKHQKTRWRVFLLNEFIRIKVTKIFFL